MQKANSKGTKPLPPQQQQQSLIIPLCEFGYMDHMTLLDSVKKDRILNQSNTTHQNKNKRVAPSHLTVHITIFLKEDL